jgi:hypothetical protein
VSVAVLALVCTAEAGPGKGRGKKKEHGVHGLVEEVRKDKDNDEGTIELKVHAKKKGGAEEAAEKTFKVTAATKFEKVKAHKKGEKPEVEAATFADVRKGEHLSVKADGDVAKEVRILAHHHKKKGDQ